MPCMRLVAIIIHATSPSPLPRTQRPFIAPEATPEAQSRAFSPSSPLLPSSQSEAVPITSIPTRLMMFCWQFDDIYSRVQQGTTRHLPALAGWKTMFRPEDTRGQK